MIVASQAAVEYAALTLRRATTAATMQFGRVTSFVSEHFVATLVILLVIMLLFAMRPGRAGR